MLAIMAYKEERQTREHYLNNGLDFGILHVKELSIWNISMYYYFVWEFTG